MTHENSTSVTKLSFATANWTKPVTNSDTDVVVSVMCEYLLGLIAMGLWDFNAPESYGTGCKLLEIALFAQYSSHDRGAACHRALMLMDVEAF